jgi:hypothetical protein
MREDRDYENEMINKEIYGGNAPDDQFIGSEGDLDDDLKGQRAVN